MCKEFETLNKPINKEMAVVENPFNYKLCKLAKNTGTLVDVCSCIPKGILGIREINSNTFNNLVMATQKALKAVGVVVSDDYYVKHKKLLGYIYSLVGLCYVGVNKRDGSSRNFFLATKNDVVLNMLVNQFNIGDISAEKYNKLASKRTVEDDELEKNYLSVIKCNYSGKGNLMELGVTRVYPNSKNTIIVPYIPARCRTNKILSILKGGNFRVEYYSGKSLEHIKTTLSQPELFRRTVEAVQYDIGTIPLYDYNTKCMVDVDVFSIVNIKPINGGV